MTGIMLPDAPSSALPPSPDGPERSLRIGRKPLSRKHFVLIAVAAFAVSALSGLALSWSLTVIATVGVVLSAAACLAVSSVLEGQRKSVDHLATVLVFGAFGLAMIPLVSVSWTVIQNGLPGLTASFLTSDMRGVIGPGGGAAHAIVGTLLITGLAAVVAIPIGLLTAIYLVEYGRGTLARVVTFLVDVMTGIPSIVAGLFAYAVFALIFGPGVRMGIAGAVALALLMTPVVVRSSEEMLKIVPHELREASLALGVPKWRTILKVVLPTAAAGIATGITLAVARVIGETAPLLIVAGLSQSTNWNLGEGRMTTLPVFAYYSYAQPGFPPEAGVQRAWTAALILIVLVMVLNLLARAISRLFAPKVAR